MAAKAAKKAAERGRTPDRLQENALKRAEAWGSLLAERRTVILGVSGAAIAIVVGLVAYDAYRTREARANAALLAEGVEAALAPVTDEIDDDALHFATSAARTEAVETKLTGSVREGSGATTAWSALVLAGAQLERGEWDAARRSFGRALDRAPDDADIAMHAIEGIAFTFEGEGKLDRAIERLHELERLSSAGSAAKITALYHIGRIHLAEGRQTEGLASLHEARDALAESDAPEMPYVREGLDRALAPYESTGRGRSEILEQLRRQFPNLPAGLEGE
jgi:tetratricopeptide (TPR) repeat protein